MHNSGVVKGGGPPTGGRGWVPNPTQGSFAPVEDVEKLVSGGSAANAGISGAGELPFTATFVRSGPGLDLEMHRVRGPPLSSPRQPCPTDELRVGRHHVEGEPELVL